MASRPCQPAADLKRIWQTLLPGTPFPACGTPDNAATAASETQPTKPNKSSADGAAPPDPAGTRRAR